MQKSDSTLQKLEVHVVAAIAVVLVSGIAFVLSGPFSAQDYGLSDVAATQSSSNSSAASPDTQPALLEPALRSLDGVTYHG
ncbi:MAG: hypothetical protein ABI580_01385 [Burkholderiaceae bacterium]